jgi:DNA ligase D
MTESRRERGAVGHAFATVAAVAMADKTTITLDGHAVSISHPDKVLFPERGETKRDLVQYYVAVRGPLMATMGGRPVLLQRFPSGAGGSSFFQKRVPKNAPKWLETTVVSTPNGTTSDALVAADLAHVAWAVNLGCLGFHVWPNHAVNPEIADELRLDLDPSPGVTFDMIREAAREVRALLEEHGISSYPKTTGSRGVHIYARLEERWTAYDVRAAAVAAARELQRRRPDLLTAAWWKEERGERVFVEFNQNAPHKTVFGAWSVRADPHGQVSTPLAWDELDDVDPTALTLATVPERLAEQGDPWAPMYDDPQSIASLVARYEQDLADGLMDAPWPPQYPKQPNEPPRVQPSRAKKPPAEE